MRRGLPKTLTSATRVMIPGHESSERDLQPSGAAGNPKRISGGRDFKYETTKFSRSDEANYVCVCVHMLRLESRPILCRLNLKERVGRGEEIKLKGVNRAGNSTLC